MTLPEMQVLCGGQPPVLVGLRKVEASPAHELVEEMMLARTRPSPARCRSSACQIVPQSRGARAGTDGVVSQPQWKMMAVWEKTAF